MDSNPLFKPSDTCKTDEEFFKERFKRLCNSDITIDCEFSFTFVNPKYCRVFPYGYEPEIPVIKGHKSIFSVASPVFYNMFYNNSIDNTVSHENGISKVVVKDLDKCGFEAMKNFIYTGEVDFNISRIENKFFVLIWTYKAASKYGISQLVNKCIEFMEKEIDNDPSQAIDYYSNYNMIWFNEADKLDEIFYRAIENQTYRILNSNKFIRASRFTVLKILDSETLALNSELDLLYFIEKRAIAEYGYLGKGNMRLNCPERNHIRFLTMSASEFALATKTSLVGKREKLPIALNMLEFGSSYYPYYLSEDRRKRNFTGR